MRRWNAWGTVVAGLLAGAGLVAAIPSGRFFIAPEHATDHAAGERWACAMMDYIGTRPGLCPVCGMKLERVTAGELNREQQRRMGISTTTVITGPATTVVRAYGRAEYDDRYSQVVIARISGRIVKRHQATFGCCEEIAVGDPIIDLYSPEAFQAQGELAAAIRTGDQALVRMVEERFTRWNLGHVAAAIKAGKAPVDTVTIFSPAAGQAYLDDAKMTDQTLMVGSEIRADLPLVKLVDAQRLTLVVQVPENRARFLRLGQQVQLAADDVGELPHMTATVGRLANELDPETRTREVRIYLTDGRRRLLAGALVAARIQAGLGPDGEVAETADQAAQARFPLIPASAVLSTGVRHVVWRVQERRSDGTARFEPVAIALGPRLEDADGRDRVVVRAGLKPGDEVATQGQFLIDSQAQLAGSVSLLFPDGAVRTAPAAAPAAGAHAGHGH